MINKNGLNVIISHDVTKPLPKVRVIGAEGSHVNRVRKAMVMQIQEMQSNPKWLAYVAGEHNKEDSQNGKDNIPKLRTDRQGEG